MRQGKGIKWIRKRDGRVVRFEKAKIADAIAKALSEVRERRANVNAIANEVAAALNSRYAGKVPDVEIVQNLVEEILIKNNLAKAAKAYILYRQKHKEMREARKFFGIKQDIKLSINASRVLEKRYLLKDEKGEVIESPKEMFRRIAKAVAKAEGKYTRGRKEIAKTEREFFSMLARRDFLPNTPTMMNAGTKLGQLSACFVLPVGDSVDSIFTTLKDMAKIHQSGGGTGFNFSHLRPKGDIVMSTKGVATGPVSFMKIFDMTTEVIKQGGKRRGANMGILDVTHPDIVEFITAKARGGPKVLKNFNVSVAVGDAFMRAVKGNKKIALINSRTKKKSGEANARELFDLIITSAWESGDPGLIFMDEINRKNQTPALGRIEATNPCGEEPLYPNESCNLGSINLGHMVNGGGRVDWERLRSTVHKAVRFLDDVIEVNKYPTAETAGMAKKMRRIGLGVMGFAEMLVMLGLPYDSAKAVKFAERLMRFISNEARKASAGLAARRGSFPALSKSVWGKRGYRRMRNASLTTIAPTGTISIIADCSSGIEPLFAVCFVRNVMAGTKLLEVNPMFEAIAKKRGFYSDALIREVAMSGSIRRIKGIPEDVKRLFATAHDIAPEWHVRMQAAFQKHTDNAVSKTINFPEEAGVEDVRKAYLLAYKLKCKGITVYRYGSKPEQVLSFGKAAERELGETLHYVSAESEFAGGCPTPYCPY